MIVLLCIAVAWAFVIDGLTRPRAYPGDRYMAASLWLGGMAIAAFVVPV